MYGELREKMQKKLVKTRDENKNVLLLSSLSTLRICEQKRTRRGKERNKAFMRDWKKEWGKRYVVEVRKGEKEEKAKGQKKVKKEERTKLET